MGLQEAFNSEVEAITSGNRSNSDPTLCACGGSGWILTDFDTWHECPAHRGQKHPEDVTCVPHLQISIERIDGSLYEGVIGFELDGDRIYNNGPVYYCPETKLNNIENARKAARRWRAAIQRYQAKGYVPQGLRVRLSREWVEVYD